MNCIIPSAKPNAFAFLEYLKKTGILLFFSISVFIIPHCAVFQPITEPGERILRRGSCIAFDIPPITLTPAQTAAERQLLGEEVQIEPDGWLITSAQNAGQQTKKQASEEPQKDTLLRRYYVEKAALEYYEKTLTHYRSAQVLGESFDGQVRIVPLALSKNYTREERELAQKLAFEVNRSRRWLYEYHVSKIKSQKPAAVKDMQKKYLYSYYEKALERLREWIYTADKKWSLTP